MISVIKDKDGTYILTGLTRDQVKAIEDAGRVYCTAADLIPVSDAIREHNLTNILGQNDS